MSENDVKAGTMKFDSSGKSAAKFRGANPLEQKIIDRLNLEGTRSMNKAVLHRTLEIDERDSPLFFETIRRMVLDETLRVEHGGRGGMLCLNDSKKILSADKDDSDIGSESDLYPKIIDVIKSVLLPDAGISQHNFVIGETAEGRGKKGGGKWSRPDISIVAKKSYSFLQPSGPLVITIEVKKSLEIDVDAIYQARHHRRFGHYSYLFVRIPKVLSERQIDDLTNLVDICRREIIGLTTFTEVEEWSTYEFRVHPFKEKLISIPDSELLDRFIAESFSDEAKLEIMQMTRGCCRIEKQL